MSSFHVLAHSDSFRAECLAIIGRDISAGTGPDLGGVGVGVYDVIYRYRGRRRGGEVSARKYMTSYCLSNIEQGFPLS